MLYESADDGGYVDPKKVSDVLGVFREEVASDIDPGDTGKKDYNRGIIYLRQLNFT